MDRGWNSKELFNYYLVRNGRWWCLYSHNVPLLCSNRIIHWCGSAVTFLRRPAKFVIFTCSCVLTTRQDGIHINMQTVRSRFWGSKVEKFWLGNKDKVMSTTVFALHSQMLCLVSKNRNAKRGDDSIRKLHTFGISWILYKPVADQ